MTMSNLTMRADEVLAMSRRELLKCAAGLAATVSPLITAGAAYAEELKTFRCYGIPTNAPPDWATFKAETGMDMQWLDIGPGYMGGFIQEIEVNKRGDFTDGFLFEGGIQMKLGGDGYFLKLDPAKIPLWEKTPDLFKKGPLYQGKDGSLYGVPTIMNADSFGYWPEALDANPNGSEELSWALLYESDKTKGKSSVNDQWVLTMPTAANYLKVAKGVKIGDPANLTPDEAKAVADFLIERKRAGQFRVLWSSFEESIDLLGNKEVTIINCWKPAVEELKRRNLPVQWAYAKEGYYKWGNGAYLASQVAKRGALDSAYKALNYFLGGAYGAVIADYRGHGTANMDLSLKYAKENSWPEEKIKKITNIQADVTKKFEKPFWNNLAPDHATEIETEFERFKNS
jgi:putative spermidine/putrescine transport system substrate-binding protein